MISRRELIAAFAGLLAGNSVFAKQPFDIGVDKSIVKIAFGSCVSQRRKQHVWEAILEKSPDLFVMLGDGVYPEHEEDDLPIMESIERAYDHAATRHEMVNFKSEIETIAIWDDNDYGGSDIGRTFSDKKQSRDLFLGFWCDEDQALARTREDGIYGLWELGAAERRIQIIVPDLRFCRSEWAQTEDSVRKQLGDSGFGPYKPLLGDDVTMLGEKQWRWLERCFKRPAEIRILFSSIQVIPQGRGWESWSNFPAERQRLFDLIKSTEAEGLFVASGDTHYGEFSYEADSGVGYPLWEVTSSGLTESWPVPGPNPSRVGPAHPVPNFGLLTVNWVADDPVLAMELFDDKGKRLRQLSIQLSSLSRRP